jgi:hypothetical protein
MEERNTGTALAPVTHINQYLLSKRWHISARTLEHWRWEGTGPSYIKVGRRVIYALADIEEFERKQRHSQQPAPVPQYLQKRPAAR